MLVLSYKRRHLLLNSSMTYTEMLIPTDYASQEEYDIAMKTLEILIREYETGKPKTTLRKVLSEIGAEVHPEDASDEVELQKENYEIAKLSVERYRATIH